jgi:hypothetical protein
MTAADEFDPYLHDPSRWGVSMAHHRGLLLECLDAVGARSVVEIGAYAGDLTRVLAAWAQDVGARVIAVDPAPHDDLVSLADRSPAVELIRDTSLGALPTVPQPDAVIIDGDHNYYTVGAELTALATRADGGPWPLLLFHDVGWPHGRRDDYFDPGQIPADARQPLVGTGAGIRPDNPGVAADGLPYPRSAAREGGPRNGVLSAIEDFVSEHPELELAVVPAFFGFGVAWDRRAPWASRVAELLAAYDRQPLLEQLEANRVHHIAEAHALRVALWNLEERQARREALLRRLLDSRAFALAERLSRLRVRIGIARHAEPITKEELQRDLEE